MQHYICPGCNYVGYPPVCTKCGRATTPADQPTPPSVPPAASFAALRPQVEALYTNWTPAIGEQSERAKGWDEAVVAVLALLDAEAAAPAAVDVSARAEKLLEQRFTPFKQIGSREWDVAVVAFLRSIATPPPSPAEAAVQPAASSESVEPWTPVADLISELRSARADCPGEYLAKLANGAAAALTAERSARESVEANHLTALDSIGSLRRERDEARAEAFALRAARAGDGGGEK